MSPRLVARGITILTAVGVSWTCSDSTAPTGAARIDVVPAVVRLGVGRSVQLAATAKDDAGAAVPGVVLRYQSEDNAVATVTSSGRVTGAGSGVTTVIVDGGGASARVPVRVGGVPATIEVTPAAPEVPQGASLGLVVVVRDSAGAVVPDAPIAYATSDPAVATVSTAGVVTGVGGGPATITVTAMPALAAVPVTVLGHPGGTDVAGTPLAGRPYGVAVSRAGVAYVTIADAGALGRADLPDTTFAITVPVGAQPTDVAFDPTGTRAYVTNQASGNVGIVDVATNTQIDVIPVPGNPFRVLVKPDGSRLYITDNAGNLLVVQLPSKAMYAAYSLGAPSNGIAFHPNGVLLYGTTTGGLVFEINTVTDSARAVLTTGILQDIAVARDGSELYIAKENGDLEIRSAPTGALITEVPAAAGAFGLRLSPDGRHLYAGIPSADAVRVIDRATRGLVRSIPINDPRRIAFDRYGTTAVIASQSGNAVYFVR